MKKSRFNEKQIFAILKEQEMGKKITEICREHGMVIYHLNYSILGLKKRGVYLEYTASPAILIVH
jgi:hypothetical protein